MEPFLEKQSYSTLTVHFTFSIAKNAKDQKMSEAFMTLTFLLAHLSRRLIGELIV